MKSTNKELPFTLDEFISDQAFPCVASKAALAKGQIQYFEASSIHCPAMDEEILQFLYAFVDHYRKNNELYQSAIIIFSKEENGTEENFETSFWQRLQSLSTLDAAQYAYDSRVEKDPQHENFSFSLKGEAFFVIALHPQSSRQARRFVQPALVFNPHAQFEQLRMLNKYDRMKQTVRTRDLLQNGSVNPMLQDFGAASEAYQYSGKQYHKGWKCPLHINHKDGSNSAENRHGL